MNDLAAGEYEVTVSLYGDSIFTKNGGLLSFKVEDRSLKEEDVVATEATTEPGVVSEAVIGPTESETPIQETDELEQDPVEDDQPVQVEEAEVVPANGTNSPSLVSEEGEQTKNEDLKKIITLLYIIAVEIPVGLLIIIALFKIFQKKNPDESPTVPEQKV